MCHEGEEGWACSMSMGWSLCVTLILYIDKYDIRYKYISFDQY
jgi:hypothetical protein